MNAIPSPGKDAARPDTGAIGRGASGTPKDAGPRRPAVCAVSAQERHEMIATAAYFYAEARGFAAGAAVDDWLRAERDIDAALAASAGTGSPNDTAA